MKIIKKVKSMLRKLVNNSIPKYCSRHGFLIDIYYLFFDHSFKREMRSVLVGKVKHINEAQNLKENYYLLVRNIHRIEKGLLMRPRRDIFAKNFIEETIDSFEGVWKNADGEENLQLKWFHDVLTKYFSISGKDKVIQNCAVRFNEIIKSDRSLLGTFKECSDLSIPYNRDLFDKSKITYSEFLKLAKQRRSVRWFLNRPVDRSLLDSAIRIANLAPSACNRQPFEFAIFDNPELLKKAVDIPMGTKGYGHSIPVMLVIVGNLDAYFDERDRHIIYIDASLAAMSLMFALETLGLSSCPINWPDIESKEREMDELLGLEVHQRPIMCLGIGYADPAGLIAFSEKRPLNNIRYYNEK